MAAIILDGKTLSQKIASRLRREVMKLKTKPALVIVQVGEMPQSSAYIARKKKFAEKIGATAEHIALPLKIQNAEVIDRVAKLNADPNVHGIIVQLPLPKHLDRRAIIEAIDPNKDVDGLTSKNAALIYESAFGGQDPKNIPKGLVPATAKGVMTLLKNYKVPIEGKKALVIGRSLLVGKPAAMLLLKEHATVTIAHSKSKNLQSLAHEADIVVCAAGQPKLLTKKAFRKGQVIIDVGTNAVSGQKTREEIGKIKLVGDVDFQSAVKVVKAISPVPGGIGPMTVASLFENLLEAQKKQGSGV